jgi:hypothetical protein
MTLERQMAGEEYNAAALVGLDNESGENSLSQIQEQEEISLRAARKAAEAARRAISGS